MGGVWDAAPSRSGAFSGDFLVDIIYIIGSWMRLLRTPLAALCRAPSCSPRPPARSQRSEVWSLLQS